MKKKNLFLTGMIFALAATSLVAAQRGAPHGTSLWARARGQSEELQRKARLQATPEQGVQLRNCFEIARLARILGTDLKNPASLSVTVLGKTRQASEVVRWGIQSGHEAFLQSLNTDQQTGLKDRLRKLDRAWSELAARFDRTDRDLRQTTPDLKVVSGDAKDLEKSLKKWEKQHRELQLEMGVRD